MILTTTANIDGKKIIEYKAIVFGEVVTITTSIGRPKFGAHRDHYEDLIKARESALQKMSTRAAALGGNAVVGVKIDYEAMGVHTQDLLVVASGTAVIAE